MGARPETKPAGLTAEEFLTKLRGMKVRVESPDHTVRVVTGCDGTVVELATSGSRRHNEASLAKQISAALEAARHGSQRAVAMLVEHVRGPLAPDVTPLEPDRRIVGFLSAVDAMTVEAVSPRGLVRIRLTGSIGVAVSIRPGALWRGTDGDEELMAEVNAAVHDAHEEYGRKREVAQINHLREEY